MIEKRYAKTEGQQTVVYSGGDSETSIAAFKKVLAALKPELRLQLSGEDAAYDGRASVTVPSIGLLGNVTEADFYTRFHDLESRGCHYMVITSLERTTFEPWRELSPKWASAFGARCLSASILDMSQVLTAIDRAFELQTAKPRSLGSSLCGTVCSAVRLHEMAESFSHGGKYDITNTFLAPARVMALASSNEERQWTYAQQNLARQHIDQFNRKVIVNIKPADSCGELGIQLQDAWRPIMEACGQTGPVGLDTVVNLQASQYERLMDLLTEIRVAAGKSNEPEQGRGDSPGPVLPVSNDKNGADSPFRILVVDDHAAAWRPVFKEVAQRLEQSVCFEFSVDARHICLPEEGTKQPVPAEPEENFWRLLPDYDLVVLDIFLPKANGLDILKKIRERIMWLPVLLWTSTVEAKFPSLANLSNGFVFKKTASCKDIAESIGLWLEQGRSRRTKALPNPFFDHVLRSEDVRRCALDFTNWAIKYMDSFHALDDTYFKYFNDHGGRHILGALGAFEKLLRPLLFDRNAFSDDPARRECELLWLFLGALCHDIGMFPMPKHGVDDESFDLFGREELKQVRRLHSLRSMLLMWDERCWLPAFRDLMDAHAGLLTREGKLTIALVGALHGSLFTSRSASGAGKSPLSLQLAISDKGKSAIADWESSVAGGLEKQVESSLNEMNEVLGQTGNPARITVLCNLFRLADGLDIDHSRVPADFILHGSARSVNQDWENLKRQVVDGIDVRNGIITLRLSAGTPDANALDSVLTEELLAQMCQDVPTRTDSEKTDRQHLPTAAQMSKIRNQLLSVNHTVLWSDREWLRSLKEDGTIDEWGKLFLSWDRRGAPDLHRGVACLCALAVASEVQDEYLAYFKSANDAGQALTVELGNIEWGEYRADRLTLLSQSGTPHRCEMRVAEDVHLRAEDEAVIGLAFEEIFSRASRRHSLPSLRVSKLSGGKTGASTLLIEPVSSEGLAFPSRFCKLDHYARIEQEYHGLLRYASVYLPPRNLITDTRLARYRDRGVMVGEFLAGGAVAPVSLEDVLSDQSLALTARTDELTLLYRELIAPSKMANTSEYEVFSSVAYGNLSSAVQRGCKDCADQGKALIFAGGVKQGGMGIRDETLRNWLPEDGESMYEQLWNRFFGAVRNQKIRCGFRHGDLHAGNVLVLPGNEGIGKFIIIDTFRCGYGHIFEDLASFIVQLNTAFVELLWDGGAETDDAMSTAQTMSRSLTEGFRAGLGMDEDQFNRECSIAISCRLFELLTRWPSDFDEDKIDTILQWAWRELEHHITSLEVVSDGVS